MIEIIRKMVSDLIKPDIILGKIKSFEESNWTVEVELNRGGTIDEVSIKSVVNTEESGMYVEPVVGSYVLLAVIDGKIDNLYVLGYSQIKRVRIMSELIELNGDEFGGIVKSQNLESNLDKLKTAIETLRTATAAGLTAVGAGPAANGATGASAFNSQAQSIQIQFEEMKNEKVKHG